MENMSDLQIFVMGMLFMYAVRQLAFMIYAAYLMNWYIGTPPTDEQIKNMTVSQRKRLNTSAHETFWF